ncbi:hypothetical protein E4U47_001122, partial [Claviceps purpurea]
MAIVTNGHECKSLPIRNKTCLFGHQHDQQLIKLDVSPLCEIAIIVTGNLAIV